MSSNTSLPHNQPTHPTQHSHSPKSSFWRIPIFILLRLTPTQRLPLISNDTKQRTYFLLVPALRRSASSSGGAPTNRNAISAYDADIADRVGGIRLWASFLVLVILADVGVGAAGEVTGRGGAFGAGPTVRAGRTCKLAAGQSIC